MMKNMQMHNQTKLEHHEDHHNDKGIPQRANMMKNMQMHLYFLISSIAKGERERERRLEMEQRVRATLDSDKQREN